MAEEIVKVITIDTDKSEKSIKDLRKEVKDLKKEMEDLSIGSAEWARKVQELDDVQEELNASMLAAKGYGTNLAAVYDSTAQIVSGLTAGMSAVNAVTVMFGSENEDLQKTMVKLQAAMALVQGVQGLRGMGAGIERAAKAFRAMAVSMGTATAGTKGLRLAMVALKSAIIQTGIGALVVLLGFLIDKLTQARKEASAANQAAAATERIEDQFERSLNMRNHILEELQKERELAIARGTKDEIEIWREYVGNVEAELEVLEQVTVPQAMDSLTNQFSKVLQDNRKVVKEFKKVTKDWPYDEATKWTLYSKNLLAQSANLVSVHQQLEKLLSSEELEAADGIIDAYKNVRQEVENTKQLIVDANDTIAMMEAKRGKEQRDANAERAKELKNENDALLQEIAEIREENLKALLTENEREDYELIESVNKQLQLIKEAYKRKLINEEKYNEYVLFANDAHKVRMWNITKERVNGELEIELEGLQARRDALNEFYANREAALDAEYNKPYETFKMGGYYQSTEDRKKEYEETVAYANMLLEYRKQMYEKDNALMNEQEQVYLNQRDSNLKILQEQMDAGLIYEEDYNNQKLEIEKAYNDAVEELALQREANDIALKNAEIERDNTVTEQRKKNIETINSAMMSTYSVASSLTGALANVYKQESQNSKKSQKEQEKAFQAYKALAITQAIIDTISSAQGAYSSMVGIPYVGPILAPIAAAAAVVAGIANVNAIRNETMPGGGTAETATASVEPPAALQTAPISYTRNLLGNKETDELNKPIKCYVLESDITETQNKVKVTEDNASF